MSSRCLLFLFLRCFFIFLGWLLYNFEAFLLAARRGRLILLRLFPVLIIVLEVLYVFLLTGFFFFFGYYC